jgi:hypothetical protein
MNCPELPLNFQVVRSFISFTPFCVGVTNYDRKDLSVNKYFLSVVFIHIPQLECAHGINSHYQGKGQGSQDNHGCGVPGGWHPAVPGQPMAVWNCGATLDFSQSIEHCAQ